MRLPDNSSIEYRLDMIVRLSNDGKSQEAIASLVRCSQSWVSQVLKRYRTHGSPGLLVKGKAPGNASRLDKAQLEGLKSLLLAGALAHGFDTDNWSRERIAKLIEERFGTRYHVSHVSKLMQRIGFTLQKPNANSYRKDAQEVAKWKQSELPALKKSH